MCVDVVYLYSSIFKPILTGVPQGGSQGDAQEALWDSAVGRKGHPTKAPYRRESLFCDLVGIPWGVLGVLARNRSPTGA